MVRIAMRIRYVQIIRSKGIEFAYYRRDGRRVPIKARPIASPAFAAEVEAIEKAWKTTPIPAPKNTVGVLIAAYKKSPRWNEIKPATRASYERAFAALKPLENFPAASLDRPKIFRFRDSVVFPKNGRWMANYAVTVLGLLLAFGVDAGMVKANPLAEPVRKLRKAKGSARANRPWTAEERAVVLAEAPNHVLLPLALLMTTGMRKADVFKATLGAIKDGMISVRTSKTDQLVSLPVHPVLASALATRPTARSLQIALNSDKKPWTPDGFDTVWHRFRGRLEAEGKVAPGLTLHGLRHTLGTLLKEAGLDDGAIADVLGQSSTSMARHYSREAQLSTDTKAKVRAINFGGGK